MTRFTDLTHEQRMLVHQATTEVYSRITCISTGAMAPLDAMADFFMTAYQLGQQAPRPSDMVVAHSQENARSVSDGAIYAATSKLYSEYDRKLQHDIAHLQNEHLPYCKHCKQRHAYSDPCELLQALRQATAYAQEEARRALDTTQPLVIFEPEPCPRCGVRSTHPDGEHYCHVRVDPGQELERDDPHEDLGYRGRK